MGYYQKTYLDPLYISQKKLIDHAHYRAHTAPIFDSLNILRLEKLTQHRIMLSMYKLYHCNSITKTISTK